jgi:hypothetical protein
MNNLVPGIPAFGGRSMQDVNRSGLLDHTTAATFGMLALPGHADAAMPVMPSGNG